MRYVVRIDGMPGPRGRVITPYPTRGAAELALEQELAWLGAHGATVIGDAAGSYVAAYEADHRTVILRLALEPATETIEARAAEAMRPPIYAGKRVMSV